ncbi:MAG: hypothetical protein Q4A01_12520, partial [Coriobacteriales bacterium]|nr:hypothetical protein [Coriobacteriales bacterium]
MCSSCAFPGQLHICRSCPFHVTVDYMHYSVPHALIGRQVDVRMTSAAVAVLADGEVVAEHPRLRGRKGQYSTVVDHMPDN